MSGMHRREFGRLMVGSVATAGAALLSGSGSIVQAADEKPAITIAHLTDTHVQPELAAAEGLAACLRHVQSHASQPELIVTGGDLIMDAFKQTADRTRLQWDLWKRVLKSECSLPVQHCLGNHDLWGWDKSASGATGDEPNYGKKYAVDELGLPGAYHTFEAGGWQFIVLDSVQFKEPAHYSGGLGDEQFEWLKQTLAETPAGRPVCVVSHIPIFAAVALLANYSPEKQAWSVSNGLLITEAARIMDLFSKHPNVKLCLSGHLHRIERIDFRGVSYLCNGAVSGKWWRGQHYECDCGYAIVKLYSSGAFSHEYVTYGWTAKA
jgi:3',5'-cyclic AMP phosphodiesterase CpdA